MVAARRQNFGSFAGWLLCQGFVRLQKTLIQADSNLIHRMQQLTNDRMTNDL